MIIFHLHVCSSQDRDYKGRNVREAVFHRYPFLFSINNRANAIVHTIVANLCFQKLKDFVFGINTGNKMDNICLAAGKLRLPSESIIS